FNSLCSKAVKYLCLKSVSGNVSNKRLSYIDEPESEEFVLVIKPRKIECFCTNENVLSYLETLLVFNNVIVYHYDSGKDGDVSECDDLKLKFLRKFIASCHQISLPYNTSGQSTEGDHSDLKSCVSWPLIQSFVFNFDTCENQLDFSRTPKVADFSAQIIKLCKYPDALNFEDHIVKNTLTFCWAFENCLRRIETGLGECMSPKEIIEPLYSYFRHAEICEGKHFRSRPPVALLGQDSCQKTYTNASSTPNDAEDRSKETFFHILIRGTSLLSHFYCTRTYFTAPKIDNSGSL
uniref:HA2 domain-containing protein n=1 Tax=Mesocestoides corti TaxID=53468 RepID=A0A5K3FXE7_MESCO